MSWDRTGQKISGQYLGKFPFAGVVESSRVKYGGSVQHTVVLDNAIEVFGELRERVLIGEGDL